MRPLRSRGSLFQIDAGRSLIARSDQRANADSAWNPISVIRRAPSNYERQCQWDIEEYFRTLKTAGFQLEDSELSDPEAFMNFATMAAIAAVTVTQLLRARDNPGGQSLLDAFDAEDEQVIEAICADYEGPNPSSRQTNPHPRGTLARATWVLARLGGWTGYYGKPGPRTLNRGFERFKAIRYGARLNAADV